MLIMVRYGGYNASIAIYKHSPRRLYPGHIIERTVSSSTNAGMKYVVVRTTESQRN